jgi:23S rRNA (pseudouridine1915-N3)-methyltransferase
MKLHIVTIGEPKLSYAREGWQEYIKRLGRYHDIRTTHLADKWAHDHKHILTTVGNAYLVALVIDGQQLSNEALAEFLVKRAMEGREVCYVIGGPDGLPAEIISQAAFTWSFSKLTFPHDLAMVVLAETLYRSSTITAGHPYHRG